MRTTLLPVIFAALFVVPGVALCQTNTPAAPAAPLAFEVASVKPSAPLEPMRMMSGQVKIGVHIDSARVDITYMSMADLIAYAYTVKAYQVSGPEWLRQERFDITAKIPEGVDEAQVPRMMQSLLADRFKLTVHRESKEQNVYALVVGKGGPKLKEVPKDTEADAPLKPGEVSMPGPNGNLRVKVGREGGDNANNDGGRGGMMRQAMQNGAIHLELTQVAMPALAEMITRFVDRPVVDMTGLKGDYDVPLDVSMADALNMARAQGIAVPAGGMRGRGGDPGRASAVMAASDPGDNSVFTSVQAVGLKLEPRKAPVDEVVVDHIEKIPTEN